MNYYLAVLKKYAVFSGRARRAEYWYFLLFNIIFSIIVGILDSIIGTSNTVGPYGLLQVIFLLALIIPGIAVAIRRLHDIGKSGWMLLISLIPIIGGIWLLILLARDSNPGDNKYGPNPKGVLALVPAAPVAEASVPEQTPVSTLETPPQA